MSEQNFKLNSDKLHDAKSELESPNEQLHNGNHYDHIIETKNEKKRRAISPISTFDENREKQNVSFYDKIKTGFNDLVEDVGSNIMKISSNIQKSKLPKSNTNMKISESKVTVQHIPTSLSVNDMKILDVKVTK